MIKDIYTVVNNHFFNSEMLQPYLVLLPQIKPHPTKQSPSYQYPPSLLTVLINPTHIPDNANWVDLRVVSFS